MVDTNTDEILLDEENAEAKAEEAVNADAEETVEEAEKVEAEVVDEADDETASEETDESDASKEKPKKKGFFEKKKDKKDEQIEELNDRLRRNMAEFDNFRKRTEKEKAAMYEVGAKSVIEKILPAVDNFERGLATIPEEEKEAAFVQGMEKTYKSLMKILEDMDVKAIEAVGNEFNPVYHNAVMHVDDDTVGDNIIVEEFQKGYTYRGNVVRTSMVKVAN